MSANSISSPFPIYTDIDGNPLEDGYIYLGTAGLNAETNPIQAYWDAALAVPAVQPIRTSGGYPVRTGSPARIFVDANDCSITVRNKNASLIFSSLNQTDALPFARLTGVTSDLITFTQAGVGAAARTVESKLRDVVSVKDFGAVGDGVAIDTAAIQAALDYIATHAKGGTVYFPQGEYKCGAIDCSAAGYQGNKKFSLIGDAQGSRLLSTVAGTNPFIKIGMYAGYGDSDKWTFRDLFLKANTPGTGKGIYFEALAWHPRIEDCDINGFSTGIEIRSGITAHIINTRVRNCTTYGINIPTATTGIGGLDETPTSARIVNCGISGNAVGIHQLGIAGLVTGCVFEGNTSKAINAAGLSDFCQVTNNWFEGIADVIDGACVDVAFIGNAGIMSSPASPLFTNSGNSFSLSAANRNTRLHNGEYNNFYPNEVRNIRHYETRSLRQFEGLTKDWNPATLAADSFVLTNSSGEYLTGSFQTGENWQCMNAIAIMEYNPMGVGYHQHNLIATGGVDNAGLVNSYILPTGTLLTAAGYLLTSTPTGTRFYVARDGGTGRLLVGYANKHANTTRIAFRVRPLADMSA